MTTAPLPIGTRVRTPYGPGYIKSTHKHMAFVVGFDWGLYFGPNEIHRFRARPYRAEREHAKITDGNIMGTGKHVDMQHYGTLPHYSNAERYYLRLAGVEALLAQH